MEEEVIRVFSCFAGYGTDIFALKELGIPFEEIGFSEINKYAIQCFEQNHKGKNYGDISQINWEEVPDFDLITGGFPCQDVSIAGKQNLDKGRTILGFELAKALHFKKPKYFLFENVKGLMSSKFDNFRNELINRWKAEGYNVYYKVLNTKDYGIPQNRERVFFVGIRQDIDNGTFQFPEKEELKIFIKDILEPEPVNEKYYLKSQQIEKLINAINNKMLSRSQKNDVPQKEVCGCLMSRDYKQAKVVDVSSVQWDMSGKGHNSQEDRAYNAEGVMCCIPNANPSNKVNVFQLKYAEVRNFGNICPTLTCGEAKETYVNPMDIKTRDIETAMKVAQEKANEENKPAQLDLYHLQHGEIRPLSTYIPQNSDVHRCLQAGEPKELLVMPNESKFIDTYNKKVADICPTLTEPHHNSLRLFNQGIFRRLTPKECFRLQGFLKDEVNLKGLSDTQGYKLAGNGQSVNVVKKILNNLLSLKHR